MDIFVFLFFPLILSGITLNNSEDLSDCLSYNNCLFLRGACALSVVLHHISQVVQNGFLFHYVFGNIGYLAVSVFFFLSGYGLQKNNLTKVHYYKKFIPFRFFPIFLSYFCISIIYYFYYHCDNFLSVFLKLFTFSSIISISWYIIAISCYYLFFYILIRILVKRKQLVPLFTFIFCYLWKSVLEQKGVGIWCYNSIFALFLGTLWATHEKTFLKLLKNRTQYIFSIVLFLLLVLHNYHNEIYLFWTPYFTSLVDSMYMPLQYITSVIFAFLSVLFLLTFHVNSRFLDFIGKISLELYLIHQLFIDFYYSFSFMQNYEVLYSFLIIASSIVTSSVLHFIFMHITTVFKTLVNKIYASFEKFLPETMGNN